MRNPDFGERGKFGFDPTARWIARRVHMDGSIRANSMGSYSHDGTILETRLWRDPDELDDLEIELGDWLGRKAKWEAQRDLREAYVPPYRRTPWLDDHNRDFDRRDRRHERIVFAKKRLRRRLRERVARLWIAGEST